MQVTIASATDTATSTGTLLPDLAFFNLADWTFTGPAGWTATIDPARSVTLKAGTTNTFIIPVIVTAPNSSMFGLMSQTAPSVNFTLTFTDATALSFAASAVDQTQAEAGQATTLSAANVTTGTPYLDIQVNPTAGTTFGSSSPVIPTSDLTLTATSSGATVPFSSTTNPIYLGSNVWRYFINGTLAVGGYQLVVSAGALTGTSARGPPNPTSLTQTLTFTVQGPTATVVQTNTDGTVTSLSSQAIGGGVINGEGYIEIAFQATTGNTIDAATINGNEIQLHDASGHLIPLTGTPTRVGTTNVWQYTFSGTLSDGTYTVTILAGSFGDTSGITNQASSATFTVADATTSLTTPPNGGVENQAALNGRGWVDVTFPAVNGIAVSQASILASTTLLTLTDHEGDTISLDGSPVLIDPANNVFRFFFVGAVNETSASDIIVAFTSSNTTDGQGNIHSTFEWTDASGNAVTTAPPTSAAVVTVGSWVDITLAPTGTATVKTTSFQPNLVTFSGPGANGVTMATTAQVTDPVLALSATGRTYRVLLTGTFGTGTVNVTFGAGGWTDSAGNASAASTGQSFNIIKSAQAFYIDLSGGLLINDPTGLLTTDPLLSVSAEVRIVIDAADGIFQLTFTGQASVYKLGTVGAIAGFFELKTKTASGVPELWGAAQLSTNFAALQPYGLTLYASAMLEINLSGQERNVTLTLPGLGQSGAPLTQTFDLQPWTFAVAAAGELAISIPTTNVQLAKIDGGFFLGISAQGLTMFVTGTTEYGQATGLLMINWGSDHPGVAGELTVGKSASLDIPGIGSLFQISGSVSISFNTTSVDQTFAVPAMFDPLLGVNAPTSITIWGAPPNPDGSRNTANGNAPYFQATVAATITIGGVLNLSGFISITGSTSLSLIGEVSTTIPFLGKLTGNLSFIVYTGAGGHAAGVVGEVQLVLSSQNSIPGISFNGTVLLALNTFATNQIVDLYAEQPDGSIAQTGTVTLLAGPSFELYISGSPYGSAGATPVLTIGSLVQIYGTVDFTISLNSSNPSVQLLVNGSVALGSLGAISLVNSGFRIDSSGLVARLQLSLGASFGGHDGLQFSASAILSLNTSSITQSLGSSQVPPGFDLAISGSVTFLGFASASGSVDITISQGLFEIQFNVNFSIGGVLNFSASGGAAIYDGGLALSLNITASADAAVFSLSASGLLQINTGGTSQLGVPPHYFHLQLTGSISILKVLNFNASVDVIVANNGWQFSANASVDFFGIFTLSGSIFLKSDGTFSVYLSGGIDIGCCGFGLSGSFWVQVSSTVDDTNGAVSLYLGGGVSADIQALGIDFGGVSFSFSASASSEGTSSGSAPIYLDTSVSAHILFVHFHFHLHFLIGYLQLPKPVYFGTDNNNSCSTALTTNESWCGASSASPQVLYLNVGANQSVRNIGQDSKNDNVTIKQIGGSATDATIAVSEFGRTDTYQDVSQIVGDWSGQAGCTENGDGTNACQNTIVVDQSVQAKVTITGSQGDDVIEENGSYTGAGHSTVYGEGGANQIVVGGTGNVVVYGSDSNQNSAQSNYIDHTGTGQATIYPGGAGDEINVDNPTDLVEAGPGNNVITGLAQTVNLGTGSNTVDLSPLGGSVTVTNANTGDANKDTINFAVPSGAAAISTTGTSTPGNYTMTYTGGLGNATYAVTGVENLVFTGSSATTTFSNFAVNLNTVQLTTPGAFSFINSQITATGQDVAQTTEQTGDPSNPTVTVPGYSALTISAAQTSEFSATTLNSSASATITTSSGDLTFDAGGTTTATTITTTGALTINASAGNVTVQDQAQLEAGGTANLTAAAQLTVTGSAVQASGAIVLSGTQGVTISQQSAPPGSQVTRRRRPTR